LDRLTPFETTEQKPPAKMGIFKEVYFDVSGGSWRKSS
jgi:hypothetical protein